MRKIKRDIFFLRKKLLEFNVKNYYSYLNNDKVLLKYYDLENNWGDKVNPYLFEKLTGKKVISSNSIFNFLNKTKILGVGSLIVGDLSNSVIWGSGVIAEQIKLEIKPKEILALRGHYSLKKIQEVGGNCEIFGDPVLLFPDFFSNKNVEKKYKYGIIPHFKDKTSVGIQKIAQLQNPEIKIIDIQSSVEEFVIDVLSCENILSSSLHGLILADTYGIPTCRIVLSNKLEGGDFKFYDYYSGVGIKTMETVLINDDISNLKKILTSCSQKDLNFNNKALKNSLIDYLNDNNKVK
jgi:pyruvyltransferase